MRKRNLTLFRTSFILLLSCLSFGIRTSFAAPPMQDSAAIQQTVDALMKLLTPTETPTPATNSQEELMLKLLQMLEKSNSDSETAANEGFTPEQLQQLMILLNTYGQPAAQPNPAPALTSATPEAAVPIDCLMQKARINQVYTCSKDDLDPEFSIKVVWQPRIATHISGIAASGFFVEIRLELTNLTDAPWDGLRASSFSLIEDMMDYDASVPYPVHEEATSKKSKSYEMNQLRDVIMPGKTVSYFLVFDVSKEPADQSLVFRAVDRSGRKSHMRLKMPLPKYLPVEY